MTKEIVHRFLAFDKSIIRKALGKIGVRLYTFLNSIDLSNSNAFDLVNSIFCDDFDSLYTFIKLFNDKSWEKIFDVIGQGKSHKIWLKKVSRILDASNYTRYLKPEIRNTIRNQKKFQFVNLDLKNADILWDALPSDPTPFIRFGNAYEEQIVKLKYKSDFCMEYGLSDLSNHFSNIISSLKSDNYYGFNRITITNLCVILAKSLNYELHTSSLDFNSMKAIYSIKKGNMEYAPRLYPLHMWLMNSKVASVINMLEVFPEANNKPIFDNYMLLVPGEETKNPFEVDKDFKDNAVVLGEKDNHSYFICFWR